MNLFNNLKKFKIGLFLAMLALNFNLFASNDIVIKYQNKKLQLSDDYLLADKNIEQFNDFEIRAYPGIKFNLKAIKLCHLMKEWPFFDGKIKISAKDHFFIYLDRNYAKNCSPASSIPYLVIQENNHPWPKSTGNREEVGIFSLIWVGKNSQKISREKWIYNIDSIELLPKNEQDEIKKFLPKTANKNQKNGFKVFEDNCACCHSLNLKGQLEIGPDLNYPMNPLDYFSKETLKKFIRNPQSIHSFKNAKMEGFNKEALSEKDLDDLIDFIGLLKLSKEIH